MKRVRLLLLALPVLILSTMISSCNLTNLTASQEGNSTQSVALTQIALEVGETMTARPSRTPTATFADAATATPQVTSTLPRLATATRTPTIGELPEEPTQELPVEPTATATVENIIPTETETEFAPTEAPIEIPTETSTPMVQEMDPGVLQSSILASNILILEDVVQNEDLYPRIDTAIEEMGFSGGTIVNTYDASGTFLKYLNSGTNWDLVIVSIEQRRNTRLGIWDAIQLQAEQNTAVIIEIYYLDEISIGQITPLLEGCGVDVQEDWQRTKSDIYGKFILKAFDPGHPIFTTPNQIELPLKPTIYWYGDIGDIMELRENSSAQLLAGLDTTDRLHNGTLLSCYGGKVIFQTFATHDYPKDKTIDLWQNYMNFTLTNHYQTIQ